jgi:hypothetical protein
MGDRVPGLDRIEGEFGPVLTVVAMNPATIEVGHNSVQIDAKTHIERLRD